MSEIKHKYGSQVHLLDDQYLSSLLSRLCSPGVFQPEVNSLVEMIYTGLVRSVINNSFPQSEVQIPTRMTELHPDQLYMGTVVNQMQRTVVVNLARAGIVPSHVCYHTLNFVLNPHQVRQDHIMAARLTDPSGQVSGTSFGASKIGGDIKDSLVLIPDPMGATGGTIEEAIEYYEKHVQGSPKKYIALHLIVTPEYLRKVTNRWENFEVYAVRIDRGFSSQKAMKAIPGTYWDEEKGLDDHQYIVPGGGGLGEILNNSFV